MNSQHISDEDLVLYSLQSLPAGETAAVGLHLESCKACREDLAGIAGDFALVALSVDQRPIPDGARQRFMSRLAVEVQANASAGDLSSRPVVTAPDERRRVVQELKPRRSWFPVLLPWAAAFATLALAGYLGSKNQRLNELLNNDKGQIAQLSAQADRAQQVMEALSSPEAKQVTLTEGKGAPRPTARTSYLAANGALVFVGNNLKPIPADKTYELWIIPANGKAPVPAGLFRPDDKGTASMVLPKLPEGIPAKAFGVTIENAEGATSPTLPIVLSGVAGL